MYLHARINEQGKAQEKNGQLDNNRERTALVVSVVVVIVIIREAFASSENDEEHRERNGREGDELVPAVEAILCEATAAGAESKISLVAALDMLAIQVVVDRRDMLVHLLDRRDILLSLLDLVGDVLDEGCFVRREKGADLGGRVDAIGLMAPHRHRWQGCQSWIGVVDKCPGPAEKSGSQGPGP
jgi:hypothetical protein